MLKNITRAQVRFTGSEEVVVVPLFEGKLELKGAAKKLDVLCRSGIRSYAKTASFTAGVGQTSLLAFQLPKAPNHVLLVGLGKKTLATPQRFAKAGGAASRQLATGGFRVCHMLIDGVLEVDAGQDLLRSFLKGFMLAQYLFSVTQKRTEKRGLRKLVILSEEDKSLARIIRLSRVTAEFTGAARDLVNRPANDLTPARMADEARALAERNGLICRVLGRREIEKLKMGALLGISGGSRTEPRFITLHYNKGLSGKTGCPKVCLVGKGVTFDSGGISLKPWQNMNEMKGDMAGGAVVMCVLAAAARLKFPLEVIGLIPCVENMPDGSAIRPGDVITTYSGKTIEIISTDAEGRLILADALAYSSQYEPDVILDFATLTGSVVVALGTRIAAVIGNNQGQIDRLVAAGDLTDERVWQLPLDESFSEMVKGDISDYKNFAGREGGTITAAALLAEFVGKTPWMHLDIAGTFWSQDGKMPYQPKGATGYGVDLTLRFLEMLASEQAVG
ncbi:MAG: leucyl aminopeptidase [Candidatus Latescibacterota bacterium]|nr:MAG: leucyl aminopeptidase [Candidatus Latescibacterota bacterium]